MTVKEVIAVLRMAGLGIEREGDQVGMGPPELVSPQLRDYLGQQRRDHPSAETGGWRVSTG